MTKRKPSKGGYSRITRSEYEQRGGDANIKDLFKTEQADGSWRYYERF